ncbi:MAG: hypothetical protein A2V77_09875 [Anaeromyxobacter sp. RBG_16_69_14]|nr:MAG: hypothetical protein A2V77_09875 [Anaeromyxobacter sp. RBG_16_69_14]
MRIPSGRFSAPFLIAWLSLSLGACGGSSRVDPGAPSTPAGLTATPGSGQVLLSWSAAAKASAYRAYYSTSPGVTKATGTKVGDIPSTSTVVTGLTNGTTYFFVVTSVNSNSESAESSETSATPSRPPPSQADLTGTWRFSILASGLSAGWSSGTLTVDGSGTASVTEFHDSSTGTTAPSGFLPVLLLGDAGEVRDAASSTDATFRGALAPTNRNIIVATSSATDGTQSMAILLKHDPNKADFTDASSLLGFGGGGGTGSRRFVYAQLSTGASHDWEFAEIQIGRRAPPQPQYTASDGTVQLPFRASGSATRPGEKTTTLSITGDGVVTESLSGLAGTAPEFMVARGYISEGQDDRSIIVGVGTAIGGASPRYMMRIYQVINFSNPDTNSFGLTDLSGTYSFRKLVSAATPVSASGTIQIDAAGGATFSFFTDSTGTTAAPADLALSISDLPLNANNFNGVITDGSDATLHGKESYFKDVIVMTRTESSGQSLLVGLK